MQSIINKNHIRYAEYGLLVIIIGLIALFLLNRVRTLQKQAERMAVVGEINALRAGVVAMQEPAKNASKKDLSGMNPDRLLQAPPKNYLGPVRDQQERNIPPGTWYFLSDKGLLVYKARFTHDFPFTQEPTRNLRLALEPTPLATPKRERSILACGRNVCLTSQ